MGEGKKGGGVMKIVIVSTALVATDCNADRLCQQSVLLYIVLSTIKFVVVYII